MALVGRSASGTLGRVGAETGDGDYGSLARIRLRWPEEADVTLSDNAPLFAAAIAALVSLAGYLFAQSRARQDRKAKMYAEAFAAMRRFQELPYGVWRRPASTPDVRASLGQEHSDAVSGVAFHETLLRMDSDVVGAAYWDLWQQIRRTAKRNRALAWQSPVLATDDEMAIDPPFASAGSRPEVEICIAAMRKELSPFGPLTRGRTRRALDEQRRRRQREAISESAEPTQGSFEVSGRFPIAGVSNVEGPTL